ncbi:flagellar assembly protein FliW [Bdellovibrio sp. HCB290]|uniref:flagellar assembly protein FliW n=1 Tax=Bdellovibrio sp. HCB290 TaxID=3394356 RepID=UPI0039B6B2EC
MIISTSRFGQVELKQEDVLTFPEGLLGFADLRKFVLLDDPSDEIFAWLQSCESAQIAFPVLEPELFAPAYKANLTKGDMEAIKLTANDKPRFFSIVTIPDDPTQMTANLKAPVVINVTERIARQCVLQDNNLAIREPIFTKLQQRVVQNPAVAIKNQSTGIDVATKLTVIRDAEL